MYRSYSRALFWISEACYALIAIIVACFLAISCFALLQQAILTAPHSWTNNWDTVTIGATYCLVLLLSIAFCIKRRIAVRRRLQRISKTHSGINRNDLPKAVHEYISQEFARSCLISYECQPRETTHPGWGIPGTEYGGTRFRRSLLDTIADIDARAHLVIPNFPPLKPHTRMIHHFRFILPLLPKDDKGSTALHYYDSAIQLSRTSSGEPTEDEFILGLRAADEIRRM
ncbi:hypothetical protein HD554DRAFT_2014209 [Boletus coccyginus]|nr:hypothetical protein HD554DRAFT_2014209 [Boletus coccyginus]